MQARAASTRMRTAHATPGNLEQIAILTWHEAQTRQVVRSAWGVPGIQVIDESHAVVGLVSYRASDPERRPAPAAVTRQAIGPPAFPG